MVDPTITAAPDPSQSVPLTQAFDPSSFATSGLPPQTPTAVSQVSGPFGSHGTLGGVLGILGDVLLTQAGLPAQYLPKLQNAREADAVSDFSTDPAGSLRKLTMVSGLPAAQSFEDNQSLDQYRKSQIAQSALSNRIALAKFPVEMLTAQAPLINSAKQLAATADANSAPGIFNSINATFNRGNIDPTLLNFPSSADPEALKNWANSAMTVEQHVAAAQKGQEIAETAKQHAIEDQIRQQEADAASQSAGAKTTEAGVAVRNAPSLVAERAASAKLSGSRGAYYDALAAKAQAAYNRLHPNSLPAPSSGNVIRFDAQGNRIP